MNRRDLERMVREISDYPDGVRSDIPEVFDCWELEGRIIIGRWSWFWKRLRFWRYKVIRFGRQKALWRYR